MTYFKSLVTWRLLNGYSGTSKGEASRYYNKNDG